MSRWLMLGVGFLLLASYATAQEADKESWNEEKLQQLYMDYLGKEGYRPEIDSDGDVRFKREGMLYFIDVSEDDPEFFRIVLPGIWKIENDEERVKVLEAANESNAKSKVSKVFIIKDRVWVSLELFVAQPDEFKAIFSRSMSALSNGASTFVKAMRE